MKKFCFYKNACQFNVLPSLHIMWYKGSINAKWTLTLSWFKHSLSYNHK